MAGQNTNISRVMLPIIRERLLYLQSHAQRYLSTIPESIRFENDPLIRQYNLADRKRHKVSFAVNWLPTDLLKCWAKWKLLSG